MVPRVPEQHWRLSVAAACATLTMGCALNRSQVKSLRDRDAARIQFDAVISTTISTLNAIPSHCGPTRDHRVREEEFHVYQVVGTITRVKLERDHDIHIVLADPAHPGNRLVVEVNDPAYGKNAASPHRDGLGAARSMFDALVGGTVGADLDQLKGVTVRVTGVGFFDIQHFQAGRSRSCIELHPVLVIERLQ